MVPFASLLKLYWFYCFLLLFVAFYLPRSGKVMQKCRSKNNKKKGLMDFETLKPLFLVLFGIILSNFEPV